MKQSASTLFMCIFLLLLTMNVAQAETIRHSVWHGKFYPADKATLEKTLYELTAQVTPPARPLPEKKTLKALILPHAGFIYSGQTAAYASLVLKPNTFKRVILLGPDHRVGFHGGSISAASAFTTPLGSIALDADSVTLRQHSTLFSTIPASDRSEHSLEVVLPFLQYYLNTFSLIPIVLSAADSKKTAEVLAPLLDHSTLLVVSSDLSHFLPYNQAVSKDQTTIDHILHLQTDKLQRSKNQACGITPIEVLLQLAKENAWQPVLLHYANSGDTAGSKEKVVGYSAIAFFDDNFSTHGNAAPQEMTAEHGQLLVNYARQIIARQLDIDLPDTGTIMEHDLLLPLFQKKSGAFVTLTKNGVLRGCIGTIAPVTSLAEGVRQNAINAAFADPRFPPLTRKEFSQISVEVSILTPPTPLAYSDGPDLLKKLSPHQDGVIIRSGRRSATFLPQVWQQLPDPVDFLSSLCRKAGLSADAWNQVKLEVLIYHVQYFHEN